jgi:lipopolysaccharide export system permease protein
MRIIDRYISRQLRLPVIGAIVAMTLVALLGQSLSQFDAVIGRGQSAWVLFKVTIYALPQLLTLVLPIALLIGTLVAINRLHSEQEMVACFASGMSLKDVSGPILRMGVFVTVLSLFVNLYIEPLATRQMREELYKVKTDVVSSLIREGAFSSSESGLTIYVQHIEQNGLLRQIFIRTPSDEPMTTPDGRYQPRHDQTYASREGRIVTIKGHTILVMKDGSTQVINPAGVLEHLTFGEYSFDITDYFVNNDFLHYKESDRFLHELFFPNMTPGLWEEGNWGRLFAEGHLRLSSPLYNFAFVLLAIVGVLGGKFSRNGYSQRIAAVFGIAAMTRIVGIGIESACVHAPMLNFMQYLVPLVPIIFCWRIIMRQDKTSKTGGADLMALQPLTNEPSRMVRI